ncbi:MAG: competence type IV pilus minor pilin ComGG [Bacillus sp. (in: firmicutes)]
MTEKRFAEEVNSKLMLDHLLFLAKEDAGDYLHLERETGEDGILFYENGDVYYRIEAKEEGRLTVLLYASSKQGGKAEASYIYQAEEGKMIKWLEW